MGYLPDASSAYPDLSARQTLRSAALSGAFPHPG